MVTSTHPGEGKTLTAINLAFAIAREYRQTALLVDCDLKNQTVHQRLGLPADDALSTQGLNSPNGAVVSLDNIGTPSAVPIPCALMLLGGGLASMLLLRRPRL